MCITSVTISCDDRRKPNIKHVLKSAPLPTSLQHAAKQYNLKITISCDDRRKSNIKHVLKSAPLPTSLQHSAKQYNLKIFHAFFHRYFFVICIIFLLFFFFSIYFSQLSSFHIYNTTLYTHFAICR